MIIFRSLFLFLLMLPSLLVATEYFVSPQGDDGADGLSLATAFATIQRGVDALSAGDTLTIGPGEYYESVLRRGLGDADSETVIRAAVPGTVVLRGDRPAPAFAKLDGSRFVYVADVDYKTPVHVVNERDTILIFQSRPSVAELEFNPGTFYHDLEAGKLYLSTSDARSPEHHDYTVTLLTGDGLRLENAERVVIEGIGATGFNISRFGPGGAGISLIDSRNSVIRDCAAWFNGFGIEINSGRNEGDGGNVMEGCIGWGNSSPFANFRRGALTAVLHRGDTIRNSEAYHNTSTGIYLRTGTDDTTRSRLVDNLAWGNRYGLLIKGNPDHSVHAMERCIGPSYSTRENASDGLFWRRKQVTVEDAPNTIVLDEEDDLVMDAEFADPLNRDYRLQATSRFRGTGEGGIDRGPLPYEANIYYVSPAGSDRNDGLSVSGAWRSPAHALAQLKAGDTLYLEPGVYGGDLSLNLSGTAAEPIIIRGRGRDTVTLQGAVVARGCEHVVLERLHFEQTVRLQGGGDLAIKHCTFSSSSAGVVATGVDGLALRHNAFSVGDAMAIELSGVSDVLLAGNILVSRVAPAIIVDDATTVLFSNYNLFGVNPAAAWSATPAVPVEVNSLQIPAGLAVEEFSSHAPLLTRGPMGKPFGPFFLDPLEQEITLIDGPHLHSTSATTANIEWLLNMPAQVELAWGKTPAMENRESLESDFFGTFSLSGLEPGETYYFQILELNESTRIYGQHEPKLLAIPIPSVPNGEALVFSTATANRPATTWYVRVDGSDSNSGRSPDDAFATIQRAASAVNVGDTVLIGAGEYIEQVRVRATGEAGLPILFTSKPGEEVVLAAGHAELNDAFYLSTKHHVHIDGMYLLSMWVNLYRSHDVHVSRIFAGRYGRAYAPGFINARLCDNLRVTNSVALSAKGGPKFRGGRNLEVSNNVFYRNMISQITFDNMPGEDILLANNIFTDGLVSKARAGMISLARYVGFIEANNCYFPRWERWTEKPTILLYSDFAFERSRVGHNLGEVTVDHPVVEEIERLSFEQVQELLGDNGSILADPEFAGLADFPKFDDEGNRLYQVDRMTGAGVIPFHRFFATNPEVVERGMGLQPEKFKDLAGGRPLE